MSATFTVTNTNDSGAGSLRQAIADAKPGDVVKFDASLANQTITLSSGQLEVNKNLTIDGQDAPNLTISGDNKYRVLEVKQDAKSNPTSFTLRHLTITNGRTFEGAEEGAGAGIKTASLTTLLVENSQFKNNVAGGAGGGGIFAGFQGNTTVIKSKFDKNDGTPGNEERGGGAIATKSGGSLTVKNSEFTNNKGINGGAINHLLGELRVTNSKFINNEATAESSKSGIYGLGGAILTDGANASGPDFGPGDLGGKIIIRQSYFEGNKALDGGGVHLYAYPADEVIVEDSSFVANTAIKTAAGGGNGGGIRHDNSPFTISNTSFYQNVADSQGGGLWVDKKSPTTINNSTFSENKAGDDAANNGLGGAMIIYSATEISNSTLANNYATGHSGAIFSGDQDEITIANTIFDKNRIGESFATLETANRQFIDGGNNLQSFPVQEVSDLEEIKITKGTRIADPKLGEIEKIKGVFVHPLLSGSPAIDAGNNEGASAKDARGQKRPIDGDSNGSEIVDIGAYEFRVPVTDTTDNQRLRGTAKNDRLKGGAGKDTLIGGGGSDRLLGESGADNLAGNRGRDTLTGGDGSDRLHGGKGSDLLNGGKGGDTLIGGGGGDRFVFNTNKRFRRRQLGTDKIVDFDSAENDKILLDKSTFKALKSRVGNGFSVLAEFEVVKSNLAAQQSDAFIVYNQENGKLFYNPNSSNDGFGSGGLFAVLSNSPELEKSDFIVRG